MSNNDKKIDDQSRNVPALRFEGFTDPWVQCKLSEIVEPIKRKNKNNEANIPLTISDIYGIIDQRDYFNRQVASKDLSNYTLLLNGDFAYNKSYSTNNHYGTVARLDNYESGALSTLYITFRPQFILSDFLMFYYKSSKWHEEIYKIAAEGARNHGLLNIFTNDFFSTKLIIPREELEQDKISKLLSSLDFLITLEQEKHSEIIKSFDFLQNLLYPKMNNIGSYDNEEGNLLKLGDVLKERKEYKTQNSKYTLVSFTVQDGVTPKTDRYDREQLVTGDKTKKNYKTTYYNDIIYNPANLKFGAINRNKYGTALFSPIYITLEVNEKLARPEYIEYFVRRDSFIKYSLKYQQGSVYERQSVNVKDFLNIPILLPSLNKQDKVIKFLNYLENLCLLSKTRIEKLESLKQYLLQKLFL